MFLHECRQLWREGPMNYITDWWNWMDSSLILLYLAFYAIQIVVYVRVTNAPNPQVLCPVREQPLTCRVKQCIVRAEERNLTWWNPSGCLRLNDLYWPDGRGRALWLAESAKTRNCSVRAGRIPLLQRK